ncbi:hypothetical protein TNCV_4712761 [Trichonephila clavipes]|nr:hypothetical protein TNCV_4712761 [Trichonephila clavipes]
MLLFPNPLEQESLHQKKKVHLTFPRNSLTHQALLFIQLSQANDPAVQKMSRSKERAGTGKERLYPLHKNHTMQGTASKARQGRPKSPGTHALYRKTSTLSCVPMVSRRVSPSQIHFISLEGMNFRMG